MPRGARHRAAARRHGAAARRHRRAGNHHQAHRAHHQAFLARNRARRADRHTAWHGNRTRIRAHRGQTRAFQFNHSSPARFHTVVGAPVLNTSEVEYDVQVSFIGLKALYDQVGDGSPDSVGMGLPRLPSAQSCRFRYQWRWQC